MTIEPNIEISRAKKILICIPAYNEEKNIAEVIIEAKKYASDVVVYDDGSTDNTYAVASTNGAIVLRNNRNGGYGKALNNLFQYALQKNIDVVVTIDSDGQHDPVHIPKLLEPIINNEADIVLGSRFLTEEDRENVPKYRTFGIKAITRVTQMVCFDRITDATSGFRAYNIDAISKLQLRENGMAVATEILLRANEYRLRIMEVPITTKNYNIKDQSSHNPVKMGLNIIGPIFKFLALKKPLLFYGLPGVIFMVISVLFLYNALDLFSSTRYVSTNMIIISLGSAIMGIILLATAAIVRTVVELVKSRS